MESEEAEGPSEGVKDASAGAKVDEEGTTDTHPSSTTDTIHDPLLKSENVITPQRSQSKQRLGSRSRTRTRAHAPTLSSMPGLSDLSLHSPSNIVGTPFTVNSAPYEYPFPPNAHSLPDSHFPPLTPPSLLSASLSLSGPTVALSSSPPFGPDARSYSPTHPKMRQVDPPVPPGLAKKRQRWSLTLTRRENSFGSQTSEGSNISNSGTRTQRALSLDESPSVVSTHPVLSEETASGQASPDLGTTDGSGNDL